MRDPGRLSLTSIFLVCALMLLPACEESREGTTQPGRAESDGARALASARSADGLEIAFEERGSGEPAVVFVHGWSCQKEYWSAQVAALEGSHRVVSVDLGGHGASSSEGRQSWTVASLADDVVAVADVLQLERMILVGHSMGGPVSLLAAAKMPGRVLGVIGVDTLQDADYRLSDEERFAQMIEAMQRDFPGTCARLVRGMSGPAAPEDLIGSTIAMMCDAPPEVAIALFEGFPRLDFPAALSNAGVPIRAINAATFATNVDANRKYAPDFDAITMEGVGHFLFLEKPAAFNEHLLAFVAELEGLEAR